MSRKIHIAALKSVGFPALLGYNIYLKGKKGEVMKHKGGCLVWGLFILFILGAIGFIAGGEIISGILCGVIAAMCCPFIDIKKWIRIAGTIALILAMGALMPDSVGDTVPEAVEATEESTASTEAVATESADVQPETEAEPEKSEGPMVEDAAEPTTAVAPGPDSTGLDITVLDVGQALSVLVECDGEYMLYDGGDTDTSSYVVAYLKEQGVSNIEYLVASHYDSDHIAGLIGVLNVFGVDRVLGPDYLGDTDIYGSFISTIDRVGLTLEHPMAGETFYLGTAEVDVLGPGEQASRPNNNSIILRITCGAESILLMGDAEEEEEDWLIVSGEDLKSEVLVVGHHGAGTSTTQAFLDAVNPSYAIISCAQGNAYGNPEGGVLARLQEAGTYLFRTDLQGEIIGHTDGNGFDWKKEPCNDFNPGKTETESTPEVSASSAGTVSGSMGVFAGGAAGAAAAGIAAEDPETTIPETTEAVTEPVSQGVTYILNTNTHKFHYPSCSSVDDMKEKNKQEFYGTRDEAIAMGYDPCGRCHP